MADLVCADITNKALRAYYNVYNGHWRNYPEEYFERIMSLEFAALNTKCATQVEYFTSYKGVVIGKHLIDTELENSVVLEYKVAPILTARHHAQIFSNLKISSREVGLLLNFGALKPDWKRVVWNPKLLQPAKAWTPSEAVSTVPFAELRLALYRGMWEIFSTLGSGFDYSFYANATRIELRSLGIASHRFRKLYISHLGHDIGTITFDHYLVEQKLILAPVAVQAIGQSEVNKVKMLMNRYQVPLGMIVNFHGENLQIKYVK